MLNSVPRVPFYDTVYATLNLAESRSFGAAGTFAFGTGTSDSVLTSTAVPVAELYIEKDFLPVLQQVKKKKLRSSRSRGRVSLTRLTVSLQRCVHTHELYRFGLYTCNYSVQYYLGTSTAALARNKSVRRTCCAAFAAALGAVARPESRFCIISLLSIQF